MRKATIELEGKIYKLHLGFEEWIMLEDILHLKSFMEIYQKMLNTGMLSINEAVNILYISLRRDYPELKMDDFKRILREKNWNSERICREAINPIREERGLEIKEKKKVTEKKN